MNRIYSTVWNEAQGTFVVSHEKSKSKGKPSSSRKVAAQAVTAALLALGSGQALAASSCGVNSPGLQTVLVADDSTCTLTTGDSLTVSGTGSIVATPAVDVSGGVTALSITNSGSITGGNNGIFLSNGTVAGGISNSGTINGVTGINALLSSLSGGVLNNASGTISGASYGISFSGSAVTGSISNSGTISATSSTTGSTPAGAYAIALTSSGMVGDITNDQLISASAQAVDEVATALGLDLWIGSLDGSIINNQTISATASVTGNGANANALGISIFGTSVSGSITNSASATISVSGSNNTGSSALAVGIDISGGGATLGGSIVNSGRIQTFSSATSSTLGFGVYIHSGAQVGGVTNSGTITGNNSSDYSLHLKAATVVGDILNDTGGKFANPVLSDGSAIGGNIVNKGTFATGLTLENATMVTGAVRNEAGSTLTATGIFLRAIDIIGGSISGGISNAGTISAQTALRTNSTLVLPSMTNQSTGSISGALQILSNTNVTNDGLISLPASASTIAGSYTQHTSGTLRTNATNSSTFSKLTVSGTATLDPATQFDVVFADTANCAGLTAAGTLAGVITSTGGLSLSSGSTFSGTVTSNCATSITLTAVKNGNAIDLVAGAVAPTTWVVTGASNNNSYGTVSCASPVANNGTATCTGTASGGYALSSATGCGTTTVSGNTITAGPVTAACTVTGTFASTTTYAVTATANPVAGGSVSCTPASGIASGGSSTCTGTANAGYTFTNWGGDCSSAGNNATCTLTNITAAKSVTANFTAASTTQTNLLTTNGVTASMSVSGCASISNAAFAAPTTGAPSNTTFPFGMLGFTLNGCISGPVEVTVTYAQPLPSGATFYKNINGSYSPYSATLGAYTVAFSLRDGHEGDADGEVNGSIRDPGGIGVSAAPVATAAPIPTLSEWGMMFLSSLVAMFGMAQVRRRRS